MTKQNSLTIISLLGFYLKIYNVKVHGKTAHKCKFKPNIQKRGKTDITLIHLCFVELDLGIIHLTPFILSLSL